MKIIRTGYYVKGFAKLYEDAVRFSYMITEKAKYKAKILVFWEKHGLGATIDAFPVKRPTLFLWKKQFKQGGDKPESLNEKSKCPKNKRKRITDARIEEFIIKQRIEHPRLGKDKIKPLLDQYCEEQTIKAISIPTIGRIIFDLKKQGRILSGRRLSLYGKTGNLIERKQIKRKKLRRKDYNPEKAGDLLQIDTIVKFINGIKRYIVTAIDLKSDFGFAYAYAGASSQNTKDFFNKLEMVAPFAIKRVQTDNGSEFENHFKEHIKDKDIIHFHNYPKCPKMNAYVERFNRTIQEEFIDWNKETLAYDIDEFNRKLIDWLLWYNTERPHYSLRMIPPMRYIINNLFLTPQKSNMLWTHTKY